MTEEIRRACRHAIAAGYRNIDIDSSTLVDLSQPDVDERAARELRPRRRADRADPGARARRASRSASAARSARSARRTRPTPSCGPTSTGYRRELDRAAPGADRASARSASRPAPATAACRCPTAASPRSSSTSRSFASSARSPASTAWPAPSSTARRTLPDELFHHFPAVETAEIHLATGFQNALFEHPAFPAELHQRDRGLVLRELRRRAQGRPDRRAVRLHDPQEGDRPVQAPAVGPARRRTRSWPTSAARSRSCSRSSAVDRLAGDGRSLRPAGRVHHPTRCPRSCARRSRPR